MFTTLTKWLRPASRTPGRRLNRIRAAIEALEDRTVLNSTYYPLTSTAGTFAQDWSNAGLITSNNNWSNVPSIEGYSGSGLAPTPGTDPQTITGTGGSLTVLANQVNPSAASPMPGGIAEFDAITDPTVAFAGDPSPNQAPYLLLYLDTRGTGDVSVSYNVRDIDQSSRNAVSQVALQFRVSPNGNFSGIPFTNVPAAFVSDATVGGSTTKTTAVSVTLPVAVNEQPFVQLRWITADAAFGGGQTADEWVGIDDILVHGNLPPVITLNSSTLNYIENDPFTPIDPAMSLLDVDSSDFNSSPTHPGVLTVDYTTVATPNDRLIINNQGTGVGQISTSGSVATGLSVRYTTGSGTTTIGTVNANGGIASTPLIVTFTSATATQAAVQALLRDIGYLNVSDDPIPGTPQSGPTLDYRVRFVVSDGDGETSAAVTRPLSVFAVNDPPVVTLPGGPVNVTERDPARVVDPTATVTDPDSHDFDTGTLTVSLPTGADPGDLISIQNQGTGVGQVGIIPALSQVTYGGVVIGTYTGGTGALPFVITFNAATNPAPKSIQAVVQAITFQNTSFNPPGNPRPLRFVVTDGDGGTSLNVQVTVTITPVNDPPVVTRSHAGISYTENDAPTVVDSGITVADPDSLDFSSGTLTVDYISGGQPEDRLTIRNQGTGVNQIAVVGPNVQYNFGSGLVTVGQITSAGSGTTQLQVTFNPNASLAAVQAVLQNVAYENKSDNPSTVQRVARFVLSDGDGGFSTPVTFTIDVTSVNDGPTISGVAGTIAYQAGFPAIQLASLATVFDPDNANLGTGYLNVRIVNNGQTGDVLGIRDQGSGIGRIGLNGSNVTYGGATIGTRTGGTNGTALAIALNANATSAAVSALAASITFRTPNGAGVAAVRTIAFSAIDFLPGGAPSNVPTLDVNVTSTAGPNDDFYETNEDVELDIAANGVLANDPNPANLVVDVTPVANPSKGTVTLHANGAFEYVPQLNANGTDTFSYRWTNTVTSATGVAVVTIIIDPVNDAPTVQLAATSITVNEDSGAFAQAAFAAFGPGGGVDEATQIVTKTVTNDNNAMFASQPTLDAAGQLSFTPAPNANGQATVTIVARDNGGTFNNRLDVDTTTTTFTIVVRAVNDAPTFQILGLPPTVLEDAGPQTVVGFALNFKPGPASAVDELTQTPTYIITPIGTTGGLAFLAAPAIDAAGNLTYTTAPNSNGSANFLVQVRDSGGTAFGGSDLSASRNFTITVTPVEDPPTLLPDTATVLWNSLPNVIDVLANDSGLPDVGDTVNVTGVTQGTNGTVAVQPGGTGVTYQPAPGFVGTDTFQYTGSDNHGMTATATVTVNIVRANTQAVDLVALGSGPGGGSQVRLYNATTGQFVAGFAAFDPSFQGGISVATGDVNGDGVTDVIVGAGPGGGPRVMIIDGNRFGLLKGVNQIADPSAFLQNFFAYDINFTGGVTVAAGDVNGDGKADVIVGTGPGGGPNVKVISGAKINDIAPDGLPADSALLASFFAYDPNFRGGVNVGAGDANGDGYADVLTAAGTGGGAHVKSYSGLKLVQSGPNSPGVLLASFYAFDPSFRGGVNVAAGDFNGDGFAEYIVGAGQGGGSHVKVFSPFNLATPIASFFAFGSNFTGGVDVGYRARSGGAAPLLLAGTGVGITARLAAFAPLRPFVSPGFTQVANIDAFDFGFLGGVAVG